jgi:hypothetical protein
MVVDNIKLVQKSGYLLLAQTEGLKLEELAEMMVSEAREHKCTVSAAFKGFELMAFPDNTPEYLVGFYRGYMHRSHGNFQSMRYAQKR